MALAAPVYGYPCINPAWAEREGHLLPADSWFFETFEHRQVAGDGTCFYAAFAQGLFRGDLRSREQTHQAAADVRLKVGNALCGSDGHLMERDLEPQRWDLGVSETQYCRGLLKRHTAHPTLADDIIITAAGRLYNVNIAIFRADKEAIYLDYKAVRGSRHCVYLWRTQGGDPMGASDHYDALLLRGRRTSRGLAEQPKRRRVQALLSKLCALQVGGRAQR